MAKEDGIMSMLSKRDQLKFLALRAQIPLVQKLQWKNERVSRDWLKRISALNTSVVAANIITSAKDIEPREVYIESNAEILRSHLLRIYEAQPVELKSKPDEGFDDQEPIPENVGEQLYQSRKPDSTYISLVSRIQVPTSFSKRSYSDENFIAPKLSPEMECVQVKELSSPPVFFTSEVNLEAKRKFSFEYIREVSKLGCV